MMELSNSYSASHSDLGSSSCSARDVNLMSPWLVPGPSTGLPISTVVEVGPFGLAAGDNKAEAVLAGLPLIGERKRWRA